MLWIKAFHLIFVVTWFAALFYLPRLFVYHAAATDQTGIERFKLMERRLYRGIMTPSAALTAVLGVWLVVLHWETYADAVWFWVKIAGALGLYAYHGCCGKLVRQFANDENTRSDTFFRWFNEVPTVLLFLVAIMVVVKPF
ncbi:MAG: protoporphyrinogen oxidase HemJ [Gammaproteobacteria bacterium]|nr:protoporphyrinogen oxidase HemJ [Gammaproteobacteria bacterium]